MSGDWKNSNRINKPYKWKDDSQVGWPCMNGVQTRYKKSQETSLVQDGNRAGRKQQPTSEKSHTLDKEVAL
jgi:hypothetical protein